MKLDAVREKGVRFVIGLMSGSSCDGVDAALVRIEGSGPGQKLKLGDFQMFPYPASLRTRLLAPHFNERETCLLDSRIGEYLADAAAAMVRAAKEKQCEVDLISSHGHTLAHVPRRGDDSYGTLQVGNSAIIAERVGLPVVSDFRPRDMAAGGQGAPLVPYTDWLLFARNDRTVACLNIGGIANFTVVTPDLEDVTGFDTGPGNMAIDGTIRLLTHGTQHMDRGGAAAGRGQVIEEFLDYLLDHPFFKKVPPKTTGREEFGAEIYLRDALTSRRDFSMDDLLATVTTATVESIVRAFNRFIRPYHDVARIIVSGGGSQNKTILRWLAEKIPDITVRTSDQYGVPGDAREAVAFAVLGNELISGNPANVPGATGANHPVLLGKITPA